MNLRQPPEHDESCKHPTESLIFLKVEHDALTVTTYYKCGICNKEFQGTVKEKEILDKIETNVFRALRLECDHDWIRDGHDSHHDFYKCSKCKLRTQI